MDSRKRSRNTSLALDYLYDANKMLDLAESKFELLEVVERFDMFFNIITNNIHNIENSKLIKAYKNKGLTYLKLVYKDDKYTSPWLSLALDEYVKSYEMMNDLSIAKPLQGDNIVKKLLSGKGNTKKKESVKKWGEIKSSCGEFIGRYDSISKNKSIHTLEHEAKDFYHMCYTKADVKTMHYAIESFGKGLSDHKIEISTHFIDFFMYRSLINKLLGKSILNQHNHQKKHKSNKYDDKLLQYALKRFEISKNELNKSKKIYSNFFESQDIETFTLSKYSLFKKELSYQEELEYINSNLKDIRTQLESIQKAKNNLFYSLVSCISSSYRKARNLFKLEKIIELASSIGRAVTLIYALLEQAKSFISSKRR